MPKFESERPPIIRASDLPLVTKLLNEFDEITFNGYGEMVALIKTTLPIIGKIVISLYVLENHIKVYRQGENPNDDDLWNGYLHDIDHSSDRYVYNRDNIIYLVKEQLLKSIAEHLS